MCSAQQQTLFQEKDSHESVMHVNEDTVSRRLGATNKTCLYFIIATLVALLIFELATIMVLITRRTVSNFLRYSLAFSFFFFFILTYCFQNVILWPENQLLPPVLNAHE